MCPTSISFDGATDFKISGGNFGEVEGNMTVITSNDPKVLLSLQPLINNAPGPREVSNRGRVPSPRLSTQSSNHERRSRSSSVSSFASTTTEDGGAESGYSTPPSSTDGHQSASLVSSAPPHTQLPSSLMPPPRPQTFGPSPSLLPDGAAREPRDQHSYTRSPRRGFPAQNQTQTDTPSDTPTMPTRPDMTMELLSTPRSGRSSIRTQTARTSSRHIPRPPNPEPFQLPSQSTPSTQTGATRSGYSGTADTRTDVTSPINRVPHHRGNHTSQPIQPQLYVTENTPLIRDRYIHSRRLPEPPNPRSPPPTSSYSSTHPRRLANPDPHVITSPVPSPRVYNHPSAIPTGPNDSDSMTSVSLRSGGRQYSVTSVPAYPPYQAPMTLPQYSVAFSPVNPFYQAALSVMSPYPLAPYPIPFVATPPTATSSHIYPNYWTGTQPPQYYQQLPQPDSVSGGSELGQQSFVSRSRRNNSRIAYDGL